MVAQEAGDQLKMNARREGELIILEAELQGKKLHRRSHDTCSKNRF
jgi:hypothetical protein